MARLVDPEKQATKTVSPTKTLPKIDVPVYDMKIPSTGEVIRVRPFTVREEKLLMIAAESKESKTVVDTVMQILNNCIVSEPIDLLKLPFFDIDFMFIFLRAKSIGEKVELRLVCNNMVEGKACGNIVQGDLNISNTEIYKNEDISDDIKFDADKGIKMKYPNYGIVKSLEDDRLPIDKKTNLIINSIDYIYDKKIRYTPRDFTKEELRKYIEDLTEENYKKLENFVDNFPTFYTKFEVTCDSCGFHHDVRYTDFEPFFT